MHVTYCVYIQCLASVAGSIPSVCLTAESSPSLLRIILVILESYPGKPARWADRRDMT